MKKHYFIITIFITASVISSQNIPNEPYLGETLPGKIIKKFAPEIISKPGRPEISLSISPDQTEMFLNVFIPTTGNDGYIETEYADKVEGNWESFTVYELPEGVSAPEFGVGGNFIFYYTPGGLGYSLRSDSGWSAIKEAEKINLSTSPAFPSTTSDTTLYFRHQDASSKINYIYYSKYNGTEFETPQPLPFPVNNNSSIIINDPCISPKGDYVIMIANNSSLFVSFKKDDTTWTYPKNLIKYATNPSNIHYFGLESMITEDGKYIFSWAYNSDYSETDLYWVSTDIVEDARNSNFQPYLYKELPDTTFYLGQEFTYQVPVENFVDDDNDTLIYTATRLFSSLPSWLSFDSVKCTLSGIPEEEEEIQITITAVDPSGAKVSDRFLMHIETPSGVEAKEQILMKYELFQNYPNPFNPETKISYSIPVDSQVKITIFNVEGKIVKALLDAYQLQGNYSVSWNGTNEKSESVSSGVYFYKLETGNVNLSQKMILIR